MRNNFLWFGFGMLALCASIPACRHDAEITPAITGPVSFHGQVLPLLHANCALSGCHAGTSPQSGINFEDSVAYSTLFTKHLVDTLHPAQSLIVLQINSVSTPMPPSGLMSQGKRDLVLAWIQQGAKNN